MLTPMSTSPNHPQLVGAEDCIKIVFPCENSQPGLRTFRDWQSKGFIPVHKIGRRTYFDPQQVRSALERRFKINATPVN